MANPKLELELMSLRLGVCRLSATDPIPTWATDGEFFSVFRTSEELSLVCAEAAVPSGVRAERGWRCLKVKGPLDFGLTGILASIAGPLAEAKISIFAISSFDTDYILLKDEKLDHALATLKNAGFNVGR